MTTHLIIPDPHAHPEHNNDRADWLGRLILDLKPDVVVNLGDMWDFPSLSGYEKGKKSFWGRAYAKDLEAGLDFDERLWNPIRRAKRKRPYSVFLEGNHEERMRRLLDVQPELEGTVSFNDLDLKRNYDEIVRYTGSTPGSVCIDGITYSHYAVTGVSGRPVGGEHPAYMLLTKQFQSVTTGHVHVFDHCVRSRMDGTKVNGLVAGCFTDYTADWAGEINQLWSRGVVIKHEVDNGQYDLEWISMKRLRKEYGTTGGADATENAS